MDKKFSSILLGLVISLGIVILIIRLLPGADLSPEDAAVALPLTGPEDRFDFGEISMAKGPVVHEFVLRQKGLEPLTITGISTSCMCTEARLITPAGSWGPFGMPGHGRLPSLDVTLQPGEEVVMMVEFDPAAHGPSGIGRVERVVEVVDSQGRILTLGIAATVRP